MSYEPRKRRNNRYPSPMHDKKQLKLSKAIDAKTNSVVKQIGDSDLSSCKVPREKYKQKASRRRG